MIKLFEFVGRKPGMTSEDFHAYWRAQHAAFFTGTPAVRQLIHRYELNHRLPEDYVRTRHETEFSGPEWDGVAVTWFNSLEDYQALQRVPEFIEFSARERASFRAVSNVSVLTRIGTEIVDRPGGRARAELKLLCILRRNAALDRATFFPHWQKHHGGLFQDIPELSDPVLGYDQNHGLDIEGATYDGVTEQWFESLPAWIDSLSAPANYDRVAPDVAYMLDANSIQFILAGKPTIVIER
jgi:EthD domain-containing protein